MRKSEGEVLFDLEHDRVWRVTNIKSRFKVKCDGLDDLIASRFDELLIKERRNIISIITPFCTYIAFWKSGVINVTGTRSVEDNKRACEKFLSIIPECELLSPQVIDNISASGSIRSSLSGRFTSIVNDLSCIVDSSPSFDPFTFPSANIKTRFGTMCVFESGAVNLMGLKQIEHANFFRDAIRDLLTLC